jgi:ribulose-5-phosphate 4-epimerase/fuculose-1-phosphate aldolase
MDSVSSHEPFRADSEEPRFDDADALRRHLMRRAALAYRLFGAYHWGEQGDGHISARDPERSDCFWLLRYGVPFGAATVRDLVLVGPGGAIVDSNGNVDPGINITAYNIHWPIHEARPDVVCAAHTHTPYGTPWSANAELLTVGGSVDEAIGWFIMMERVAEVHVKAHRPQPISDEAARTSASVMAQPPMGWHAFNWALRARVPDPSVVD